MKSIAIITPKIDTFSNPTLLLLFEKLIEEGYNILFFGFDQLFIPKEIMNNIQIFSLPFNFFSFFNRPKSYRRPYDIMKMMQQYFDLHKLLKVNNKVEALICIDPMGMVYGGRIRKLIDVKLIYASFEIFFEDEFYDNEKKMIKILEKKYSSKADVVIIQDKKREELLRAGNNFRKDTKFVHIPVSPKFSEISPSEYDIHNDLGIPLDKTIVVYSGNLQRWSGINEVLALFPDKWSTDFWLVIHSHYILPEDDKLRDRIKKLVDRGMNITFHNKPFYEYMDYINFLCKCDIGIAVYFPNKIDFFAGKNIIEIGLSSGKFSTYMMLGLPTVTTSNTIYKELNEKYNFGGTIKTVDEMPNTLSAIKKYYQERVNGCKRVFEEELNPVSRIDELMTHINSFYN